MAETNKSGNLERIFISDDAPDTPVDSDDSSRRLDPYLSPPYATGGTMRGYIATAVIAAALAAVGYACWTHCKNPPKAAETSRR